MSSNRREFFFLFVCAPVPRLLCFVFFFWESLSRPGARDFGSEKERERKGEREREIERAIVFRSVG